jgi:hypothetical protein
MPSCLSVHVLVEGAVLVVVLGGGLLIGLLLDGDGLYLLVIGLVGSFLGSSDSFAFLALLGCLLLSRGGAYRVLNRLAVLKLGGVALRPGCESP